MSDEPNQTTETPAEPLRSRSDEDIAEFLSGFAAPANVESCNGFFGRCQMPAQREWRGGSRKTTQAADLVKAEWDRAYEACRAVHEANLPAIEHNRRLREVATKIMSGLGVPATFRRRKKSTSMYPKYETVPAGYLSDIAEAFPIGDGWPGAVLKYEAAIKAIADYRAAAVADEGAASSRRQAEIEARQKLVRLGQIAERYRLDYTADWWEVRTAIANANPYLGLAMAMQRTRNEFDRGADEIEGALAALKIETNTDKDIATSVLGALASFSHDRDGRYFRDCAWSYSALYALVAATDPKAAADAEFVAGEAP